jgi:hypothetical protein
MKRMNFISLLCGCLVLVLMVTGCVTIVTKPEPTPARLDIRNLPSGTYICVTTNAKNSPVIQINSINYASKGVIRIDFTTWQGQ